MIDNYGNSNNNKKGKMDMAFLEICAVVDAGKVYYESYYTVEGDSCIILRVDSIFQRSENTIENGYFVPTP